MAVPKRKTSPSRRNMRRSQKQRLVVHERRKCRFCDEIRQRHYGCVQCGYYRDRRKSRTAQDTKSIESSP